MIVRCSWWAQGFVINSQDFRVQPSSEDSVRTKRQSKPTTNTRSFSPRLARMRKTLTLGVASTLKLRAMENWTSMTLNQWRQKVQSLSLPTPILLQAAPSTLMRNKKSSASKSLSLLRPKEIVSLVPWSSRLTSQNSSPHVSKKSCQWTLLRISSMLGKKCFRYARKTLKKKIPPTINRKWRLKFARCGKMARTVNSVLIAPLLMVSTS